MWKVFFPMFMYFSILFSILTPTYAIVWEVQPNIKPLQYKVGLTMFVYFVAVYCHLVGFYGTTGKNVYKNKTISLSWFFPNIW